MSREMLEEFVERVGDSGLVERFTGYRDAKGDVIAHGHFECTRADGVVLERGHRRHNKRHGKWVEFYDDGRLRAVSHYENGLLEGTLKSWYETGSPEFVWHYRDNLLEGRCRAYHENGRLREEAIYKEGLKSGPCSVWDKDGRLVAQGTYKDGLPMDGTFVIEEWPPKEDNSRDLMEYIDNFLNRPIQIAAFRGGKPVAGRKSR